HASPPAPPLPWCPSSWRPSAVRHGASSRGAPSRSSRTSGSGTRIAVTSPGCRLSGPRRRRYFERVGPHSPSTLRRAPPSTRTDSLGVSGVTTQAAYEQLAREVKRHLQGSPGRRDHIASTLREIGGWCADLDIDLADLALAYAVCGRGISGS